MIENEEFEWNEFIIFASKCLNDDNSSVKQRTGISRFYYGAFCSSRDFINENETYLDENSKKIMTSKGADVHHETSKIFKHHEKYKKENSGKIISKNLNKLRKMRNKVDYDKVICEPLPKMIKESKKLSERIIKMLDQLN